MLNKHQDKKIVITGFYSGIGFQTAKELSSQGIHIIGIGRSEEKANKAIEQLKNETRNEKIEYIPCDLAEINQVKEAAKAITQKHEKIDVLINNAGIINRKLKTSNDGLENTFAVSAMASFLMTRLLLPNLLKADQPKVINLTSEGYKQGQLDFIGFQGRNNYRMMKAYSNAKLAEMLWTYEMADRLTDKNIIFRLVHPGLVPYTGGIKRMPLWVRPIMLIMRLFPAAKSLKEGARPVVESVTETNVNLDKVQYLREGTVAEPLNKARDKQNSRAIWQFLNEITGMSQSLEEE